MMRTTLRRLKKIPKYPHILLSKVGLGPIFYRAQVQLLLFICQFEWIQKSLFSKRSKIIQQFLTETGLSNKFTQKDFVRFNIVGSTMRHWWFEAFQYWKKSDFDKVVKVEGWEHFEQAIDAGKGVIMVHYHITIVHVVWGLLEQLGFHDKTTIGKLLAPPVKNKKGRDSEKASNATATKFDFLRQLMDAKKILNRGGIVRIVPDGFRGDSTAIEVTFYNRERPFMSGFADLAFSTGAQIIPTSASMDKSGRFTITFHQPLVSEAKSDRKELVTQLVTAYINHVENQWQTPSVRFISIPNLQKYLHLPLAEHEEKNVQ